MKLLLGALVIALTIAFTPARNTSAFAQEAPYPSRPITLLVPNAPGGSSDIIARIMQTRLSEVFGQPIIIVNRPGAGGNIGWAQFAKSKPDGHTIALGNSQQFVITYVHSPKLSFTPKDILPVSLVGETPFVLAAHPSLPVNTLKELIDYARANPQAIRYGAQGARSLPMHHIQNNQNVAMIEVPYGGGSGPIMNDLLGGHIQLTAATTSSVIAHFRSGKLKPIAILSSGRDPELPDVPTASEAGYPQFETTLWFGTALPSGTPKSIVDRVHAAILATVRDTEIRKLFMMQALQPRTNIAPAEFQSFVDRELIRWRHVADAIGKKK